MRIVAGALVVLAMMFGIGNAAMAMGGRVGCVVLDNETNATLTVTIAGYEPWTVNPQDKGMLNDVNGGGRPMISDSADSPQFSSGPEQHLVWHYYTRVEMNANGVGKPECPGMWLGTFTPGTGTVSDN